MKAVKLLVLFTFLAQLSEAQLGKQPATEERSSVSRENISILREDVLDAAQSLVNELRGSDPSVKLLGVVKAAKQQVAGTLYHMDVMVERPNAEASDKVETYQSSALNTKAKGWKLMFKKLLRKQTQEAANQLLDQAKQAAESETPVDSVVEQSQNSEPIPDSEHDEELREDAQVEASRSQSSKDSSPSTASDTSSSVSKDDGEIRQKRISFTKRQRSATQNENDVKEKRRLLRRSEL